jgi:putative serine protease PepD
MRTAIAVAALLASAGAGAGVAAVAVHENDSGSTSTTVIKRPVVTQTAAPAASTTPSGGMSVGGIYRRSIDGVVEVLATGPTPSSFFGGQQTESAQGTGFVVDTNGDVVTNYHVVAGADSVRVRLNDGHTYGGRVIGTNPAKDVAVVRISAPTSELHPLAFADSSSVHVGDDVVAIGDPYGLRNTVTSGIVSALGRTIQSPNGHAINGVIQTDAAINSGNSGGPLLNANGQVIGVNSQIESGSQGGGAGGGNIGIGFSIPSNTVASVARGLIQNAKSQPYVGVELVTVPESVARATGMHTGVEIVTVTKGAPGDHAGLRGASGTQTVGGSQFSTGGDVITAIDGHSVSTADQLITLIRQKKPGDQIQLTIDRDGSTQTVTVTLGHQ